MNSMNFYDFSQFSFIHVKGGKVTFYETPFTRATPLLGSTWREFALLYSC